MKNNHLGVYRVIDANFNRLREALRVLEEYVRFVIGNEEFSVRLKTTRHMVKEVEQQIDGKKLLFARNTHSDPFSGESRQEERVRRDCTHVIIASFKRAQESARVLEEYIKVIELQKESDLLKQVRFSLYDLEKTLMEKSE